MTAAVRPWAILGLGLFAALTVAACAGYDWASPLAVARAIGGDADMGSRLLLNWRIPHVLAAALVGALLGLGGAIFQGVFRNPLAEPYLLGSAGGAGVGATIALLVPLGLPMEISLPVLAFAGAWGAILVVLGISRVSGAVDSAALLLAGVATQQILLAVRSFLMLALSDETVNLQVVLSWTLGGIQTPTWPLLALLAVMTVVLLGLGLLTARGLDLLGLGDAMARGFGLDVRRFVMLATLAGAAVVAGSVAFGGQVVFVGLASPHVARWLVGPRHKPLLPAAALVGAIATVLCDAIARTALPPGEVPLGVITAIVGGPIFIFLLARQLRRW